ncbi:hypothetical protein NMH_2281 [Neisseria meningitidis H44/76]|uniref:Uncharacterized protein n=5 Tax=Neisseria meningitidis TaxID=487 RepID=A0A0H5QER7_NEIMI|nr:hypothetical protein NMH_2281 [Neisseria meningitidis H44/76]CBA04209.1 hypothetical protein NMA0871 [Neisseria meningitidis alpha275]CBA05720.1 hypothetical protein NMA0871 [Neisseria meningitidis alpha153]CCA45177.1 hypothetical protein NMALPHA522_1636 [Neisseria meningitidis alpha522]CRZ00434.1 hypothetical protein [Neisseria meningitidis serogroup B]
MAICPRLQNKPPPVMTTGQWVLTMIVFMIPLVNFCLGVRQRQPEPRQFL